MKKAEEVEQMLRIFDARQQIHDCIMRYCRGVDHCDRDLVLSAYHSGATDDHGFFQGSAEEFAKAATTVGGEYEVVRHIICNEYVEFDEHRTDVAYSETVTVGSLLSRKKEEYWLAVSSCRFLDRFEERDGQWKIAAREVVLDWEIEGPAKGLNAGVLTAGMVRGFSNPSDPSFDLGFRKWGEKVATPVQRVRVGRE
nr:nuclear transport factor 2 family protein [Sphingomonas sp. CDS-1]